MATTATLRQLGGSIVMAIPKMALSRLHLQSGSKVELHIQQNTLVIQPLTKPHYQLKDLMQQCRVQEPLSHEEQAWLGGDLVGEELI